MREEEVKEVYEQLITDVQKMIDEDKQLAEKFLEKVKKSVNATLRRLKTFQKSFEGWGEKEDGNKTE